VKELHLLRGGEGSDTVSETTLIFRGGGWGCTTGGGRGTRPLRGWFSMLSLRGPRGAPGIPSNTVKKKGGSRQRGGGKGAGDPGLFMVLCCTEKRLSRTLRRQLTVSFDVWNVMEEWKGTAGVSIVKEQNKPAGDPKDGVVANHGRR